MERVIVNNIPSSNRNDFGYRSINTSKSHNDSQNDMVNDILDLYNKTNEIERIVKENADFIKLENTNLESINNILISQYENLVDDFNSILGGQSTRKKVILASDCYVDDKLYGAVINPTTCDITARPSRKISKLAIFDSITDSIYIPDSLDVDIRSVTQNTISETDNDIFAPFYNDNQMYWTRKVVTDNTVDEVSTEYIINLAEEIMTTAQMNEITIHPFLCSISSVYARYGDSNAWEEIEGIEYHQAIENQNKTSFKKNPGPLTLNFPNVKANQIKIIIKANTFIEGETNLRNFMFGLKHVGAYINYYSTYDSYNFSTEVNFNEVDDVIVEGLNFEFNNDPNNSKFNSDIDYEFYYKDEYGSYQKIYEELPFITPSKDILIKLRFGEKYKEINLRNITVSYKSIRQDYSLIVSFMQDMRVDYLEKFNLYFTVKASDSNELTEITTCQYSFDDGVTWKDMAVIFDGLRYRYEFEAMKEVTVKDRCMIRVYDFEGRCGISNKFKISSEIFDFPPEINYIPNATLNVGEIFKLYYQAGDDSKITKHEFSDSNGLEWTTVYPKEEVLNAKGIDFRRYYIDISFTDIGIKKCMIRVSDGVNDPVESNIFKVEAKAIEPTGISLQTYKTTINKGKTFKLEYAVVPSNTSYKNVHFSTTDESIAIVDELGIITAIGKGTCQIIVESYNKECYAACDITVIVPVSRVTLNTNNLVLYLNEQYKLTETIFPSDANNKSVKWSVLNNNVSVNQSGLVTADKRGSSTVTVTTNDGELKDSCNVEVRIAVSGVELSKDTLTMKVDETRQLLASVLPSDAYNKNINFTSTNSEIVSVGPNGYLIALSPGNAMITVTTEHNSFSKSCIVNVLTPVDSVVLNKDKTKLYLDQTEILIATVIPDNAHDKSIMWQSSNSSVATVDNKGKIVPIATGTTVISAISNDRGKIGSCTVEVASRVSDFILNHSSIKTLAVGEENWGKEISIALESFLSSKITEVEEIIIKSNNENIAIPVPIDGNEWVTNLNKTIKFKVVGLNNGIATITVSTPDNRISRDCVVLAGDPISSFELKDIDIIEGMPTIKLPAGFSRSVKYDILPQNCIFHLGDCEGSLSPNNKEYSTLDVLDSGIIGVYHEQNNSDDIFVNTKKIINTYTCRGFYNNLNPFDVEISTEKYNIELNWSNQYPQVTQVKRDEVASIPLKFTLLEGYQGNISDYSFTDNVTISNTISDAATFKISSFSIDNSSTELKAILKIAPQSITGTSNSNIIKIKCKNSANDIKIPLEII